MLEMLLRLPILLLAFLVNPLLVAYGGRRPCGRSEQASRALCMLLGSHALIPVALQLLQIPLSPLSLAGGHLALLPVCAVWGALRHWSAPPPNRPRPPHATLLLAVAPILLFLLLTAPFTNFTGIDTYKWQDLASTITIDRTATWLVHPLSWFGFTPHAYPALFPLYLGSVELLGGLSIKAGFWIASTTIALLGYVGCYRLARRLHPTAAAPVAILTASLYIFAPVFVRYAHWGTGRGLLLALFPFLLSALLAVAPRAPRTWLGPLWWSLVLVSCHKAAWIAIPCATIATLITALLPDTLTKRHLRIGCIALGALGALVLLGHPRLRPLLLPLLHGAPRYTFTRYAWLLAGTLGFILLPLGRDGSLGSPLASRSDRWLTCLLLTTLPLAFEPHMYGALIALPAIVLSAACVVQSALTRHPARTSALLLLLGALTLTGATAVVIQRSRIATPPALKTAALFLQQLDPAGPFIIEAPGRARTQMQAYLTGCPRFTVDMTTTAAARPPSLRALTRADSLDQLIALLRGGISLSGVSSSWYGDVQRRYIVTLDQPGSPSPPPNARPIYTADGVTLYLKEASP